VLQSVVCVVGAVRRVASHTPHSTQYTHHILPLHSNNFNDVFLPIISTKIVTLARFRRIFPDDGPYGPKHVGAI
jgi:hypothetical protein